MLNFHYDIPTQVFFGKGQIKVLGEEIKKLSDRILLVYGGGSIKRNGLYDEATALLKESNIFFEELSGVDPNPRVETVREGVRLCKEHNLSAVLAIGGGSVIDCSKVIAAAAICDEDPWELVVDPSKIKAALPLAVILTIAATGSEMDSYAVISDMSVNRKLGTGSDYIRPRFSILDPEYTYSVSKKQTLAGTADIMSHVLENYFNTADGAFVQARMCEAVLKTCIHYLPIVLEQPDNYEARANLMWCSSIAINNMLSYGEETAWSVHPIEHELSAFYDITHGVGLAILTPAWMKYVLSEKTEPKFAEYAENVWGVTEGTVYERAAEGIRRTAEFFKKMGLPERLSEIGIDASRFEEMAANAAEQGLEHGYVPLYKEDVLNIYRLSL